MRGPRIGYNELLASSRAFEARTQHPQPRPPTPSVLLAPLTLFAAFPALKLTAPCGPRACTHLARRT